ncbi:hypothetical protein BJ322DRAFT_1093479 [Thelephora terrestris]|uniref:Uncharacterized protein n=1 Tax=Thelephora terrestris TaxID=56493 RepID=A0A9P6H489_9AGAM|nr:hypothetical protein BJ322DRAFT_1093479 [Thelephora terrestris]
MTWWSSGTWSSGNFDLRNSLTTVIALLLSQALYTFIKKMFCLSRVMWTPVTSCVGNWIWSYELVGMLVFIRMRDRRVRALSLRCEFGYSTRQYGALLVVLV